MKNGSINNPSVAGGGRLDLATVQRFVRRGSVSSPVTKIVLIPTNPDG
ncbi:MAG: hypothetical protein WA364_19855 [Candidatus Nitrosopolaris sp.]